MEAERHAVAESAPELAARTPGRTGNLSVRSDDRVAITPTAIPYDEITADRVSIIDLEGTHLEGPEPSSEAPMHLAIYRDLDVGAIVHTHSPWATVLAVLRHPIPPVHYMLAAVGGTVPVADYATYGTEALASNAVAAMTTADTTACLLANHGLLATGDDLATTIETVDHVEFTARIYAHAAAIDDPVALQPEEMDRVARKLDHYGHHSN